MRVLVGFDSDDRVVNRAVVRVDRDVDELKAWIKVSAVRSQRSLVAYEDSLDNVFPPQ